MIVGVAGTAGRDAELDTALCTQTSQSADDTQHQGWTLSMVMPVHPRRKATRSRFWIGAMGCEIRHGVETAASILDLFAVTDWTFVLAA